MPTPIPRPPRDLRVDVLRGWLQLTIFASHAAGTAIGTWGIHKAWGLSDGSEQFIFLSGLMLGSVHTRKVMTAGRAEAVRDMIRRAAGLYRTHLVVLVLFGLMLAALMPAELRRLGWGFLLDHPGWGGFGVLTTLYMPEYVNILPVFVWCMLLLPAFAWLQGRVGDWALAAPAGVYAAVWLVGLQPPSLGAELGLGFNPFAWQALFLLGAWLGRRVLLNGQALPRMPWLTAAAWGFLAFCLWLRLGWYGVLPFAPLPDADWVWHKGNLAPLSFLHALALAWVVSCLVPREAGWMHLRFFRWLADAGRHSLEVFCLGLFLSWGASWAFRAWPAYAAWIDAPLLLAGGAVLLGYARWLERPGRSSVAVASGASSAARARA